MNYLRGAVNAISAPYQYYKDINPSTLTGAIDVIVISRPKQNVHVHPDTANSHSSDETELVCSPFHVRFGKWQVLRPGDKKVNVFVNGNPVPFPMKIGEAGEAFFVFETDDDIPDDIVTSPILEATQPGQSNAEPQHAGRFGVKEDPHGAQEGAASQEPDFLDLNAAPEEPEPPRSETQHSGLSLTKPPSEDSAEQEGAGSSSLLARTAQVGKAVLQAATETEQSGIDKVKGRTVTEAISEVTNDERIFLAEKASAARDATEQSTKNYLGFEDNRGDEVLPPGRDVQPPDVVYTEDMVFDMEGYHSRKRGRSVETPPSRERTDSPASMSNVDGTPGPSTPPSQSPSPSPSPASAGLVVPFPSMRANSEPPDVGGDLTKTPQHSPPSASTSRRSPSSLRIHATKARIGPHASLPALRTSPVATDAEYMWDWGSFPQRTPVRTVFMLDDDHVGEPAQEPWRGKGRLHSEADVEADPDTGRRTRGSGAKRLSALPRSLTVDSDAEWSSEQGPGQMYGAGGRLTVDRKDPTRFRVFIDGRTAEFELSLVPPRPFFGSGRRSSGFLDGEDEVEDARYFDEGKVDYARFMADEKIVKDEDLVLRWAGDTYITRKDGSLLMDALVIWRDTAIRRKLDHLPSRSTSPVSEDERSHLDEIEEEVPWSLERQRPKRSSTDMTVVPSNDTANRQSPAGKPSSSSWVRWWRSSRNAEAARPDFMSMNTAPSNVETVNTARAERVPLPAQRSSSTVSAPASSPALPSPDPEIKDVAPMGLSELPRKRYAKTLRLTSDQLKSLNLKSGANTITFSLSATGAIACTARLFVWDHADMIVVSDIDGTITKSDALGHVFTMIGRDWTHLGVAKLYTDICRNGYKMMYLTSRAIGQADSTRDYLKGIKQNDYQLPEGPVIMSPDRLMASLHREVIMRKPEVFKMACLRDIQKLFGTSSRNPFYAGFGNRITDALSYRSVNVPSSRIFTIDSSGEVKMELLELAGYKSSYIHMTDLVDQMFPPIHRKWAAEYTDFNFWKTPVQEFPLPDLTPPSPALSARSDTSNQSTLARLRNFSLVGTRQANNMKQFSLPPPATEVSEANAQIIERRAESHLRQMSSFERLSNTLAGLASSSTVGSPGSITSTYLDSGSEDEDEERDLGQKRLRRRSAASMPGSLPGSRGSLSEDEMHFEMDEDREGEYAYEGEGEEEAAEEAFDEDLLATGEMENVPFL